MSSWEVRVAAALAWLSVLPGLACGYLGLHVLDGDPGFLFAILPLVALFLWGAAVLLTGFGIAFAGRLMARRPGVRFQTAVVGSCLAGAGVMLLFAVPAAGLLLTLYGGALLALMCTKGAERDLGGWARGVMPRDVWGMAPAKAPAAPPQHAPRLPHGAAPSSWTTESPQQGPWSPDPTTLPWTPLGHRSGPRTPWWELWRMGLAQGMPLWELLLVGASLLLFAVGCVVLWVPGLHAVSVLLILASFPGVLTVERRMRERLAKRSRG